VPPAIPDINTNIQAVNAAPVEIDGTGIGIPTGPEQVELERSNTTGSRKGKLVSPGLAQQGEIEAEFLGEGGMGVGREVTEVCYIYHSTIRTMIEGWGAGTGEYQRGYMLTEANSRERRC
jgi:hypothetical protein